MSMLRILAVLCMTFFAGTLAATQPVCPEEPCEHSKSEPRGPNA